MVMPDMDGWRVPPGAEEGARAGRHPDRDPVGPRQRPRRRPRAGGRRLPPQAAQHRQPARDRRALLPRRFFSTRLTLAWIDRGSIATIARDAPRPSGNRRARRAVVAGSARRAGAESDADSTTTATTPPAQRGRSPCPRPLVHAGDAALRAPLLPGGARVRRALRARRRTRLPPGHALPQLAAGGRVSITLIDHTDYANGFASSIPYNYIYAFRAPPDARRAVRLRRLRQAAHHPRAHPRRPPGHDPVLVPARW